MRRSSRARWGRSLRRCRSASGQRDVRSGAGAWGILTRGAVERAASFEVALLNALAPFYNPGAWSRT